MVSSHEISTQELVAALQNRSEEAFSVLYNNYSAALWSVALKITKNEVVAQDVLQEVFIKIWRYIHLYDAQKGTLFTWMLNITQNTCRDYLRSKYHQMSLMQDNITDKHYQIESLSDTKPEKNIELLILTQQLEEKYRVVLDLIYICGYTQQEVSALLQIPLGTVKTRCRGALMRLRRIYSPV